MASGSGDDAGQRWLTRKAIEDAIAALKRQRERASSKWEAPAENADTNEIFWKIAGAPKALSWQAVRHRLDRAWTENSMTRAGLNQLAAYLLGRPLEEISTLDKPDHSGPVEIDAIPETEDLPVSYPKTIATHTAVILLELPSPKLHGAVFVKPRDAEDAWYPQCGGKHNPLKIGRAFACLAHFGNPDFVSYSGHPPAFDVRAYALRAEWTHGSDRLTTSELQARIGDLQPACRVKEFSVERNARVMDMTVSDGHGRVLWTEGVRTIPFDKTLVLAWNGQPDAKIEIREGLTDRELVKHRHKVLSPLTLTIEPTREPPGAKTIVLGPVKNGLYRVRLYPLRYMFVDPPYEWWFQAATGPSSSA